MSATSRPKERQLQRVLAKGRALSLTQLLDRLEGDSFRTKVPFSTDIKTACEVLLNPFARDDERKVAIRGWVAKNQPCVFGQVAAQGDRLFISVIDDDLLGKGDLAVMEKLQRDRRTWKHWSMEGKGRHGFLLVVLSPKLHNAAPNRALKDLADRIRDLFGADSQPDEVGNDMVYEWLYLKNPKTRRYHKFRVILDFFASAGDGRWWSDHRFPGGFAFTFNSLGHMARTREWYERNTNPTEWAAKLAMLTIANAHPHQIHGRATSLIELQNGKPRKPMRCPFTNPDTLPAPIKGKDWTTYQGFHHTDHSVRAEFFDSREGPDRSRGQYSLDFSYITGRSSQENFELMNGILVDKRTVEKEIGSVEDLRFEKPMAKGSLTGRPKSQEKKILAALKICKQWLIAGARP
jgi:hypothetical protein